MEIEQQVWELGRRQDLPFDAAQGPNKERLDAWTSAHEGPRDFSMRAARALPVARRSILRIGALYIGLRYGAQWSPERAAELRRRVRELRVA